MLRAIIREHQKYTVIIGAGEFQVINQTTQMMVHRLQHSCINLHAADAAFALPAGEIFPLAQLIWHRPKHCSSGNQSTFNGGCMTTFTLNFPTGVIHPVVAINVLSRRLHGDMNGLESDEGKKWLTWLRLINKFDHLVNKKFRGVEIIRQSATLPICKPVSLSILRKVGSLRPVVGPGSIQYEAAIKATGAGQRFRRMPQMPFSGNIIGVTGLAQMFCQRGHITGKLTLICRVVRLLGRSEMVQCRNACAVTGHPCHQHGPRRSTGGSGMEVAENHTLSGKAVNVRCADLTAVGTQICEPGIINQNQHNIGLGRNRWHG